MKDSPHLLITGAAGFIGARLVEHAQSLKIPVISVDQMDAFETRPEHRGLDFQKKIDFKIVTT